MNDSDKTISIFQEWVPGSVTTLLVNFGPFSDRRVAGYTEQILQGLLYLHSERVIHRDIKGGNILIDDRGVVKLCDFGASKVRIFFFVRGLLGPTVTRRMPCTLHMRNNKPPSIVLCTGIVLRVNQLVYS